MKTAVFDSHTFDKEALVAANGAGTHELVFVETRLGFETVGLAAGCEAVCIFVNDRADAPVLERLAALGIRVIALRCAGFNNVDLPMARKLGIAVVRVAEYSPHAVAEHAVALILALDRKLPRANSRVRDGNFSLDGLVGFDLYGKTVGVLGTGKIGGTIAKIMRGFGCHVLGYDVSPDAELSQETGIEYRSLPEVLASSDIISLHVPLNTQTRHVLDAKALAGMKRGVMIINTGRGALIDTPALVEALKTGQVGAAGLDVYEEEEGVFFEDHSGEVLADEQLAWLLMCPNVMVTSHQAFLTKEALERIATTTLGSLTQLEAELHGGPRVEEDQKTVLAALGQGR